VKKVIVILVALILLSFVCRQRSLNQNKGSMGIMFYNLENFFDTIDDQTHNDDDITPNGKLNWNTSKYNSKINNLAKVLILAGDEKPDLIGICEVENKNCIKDLLKNQLFNQEYDFIHYDSPDERGIDVGLIYHKNNFRILESYPISVKLSLDSNDKTRDLLFVKLVSNKIIDTLNIVVCHFPSRSGGKERSERNRIDAAKHLKQIIEQKGVHNKWLVMGDFNDEPWDYSIFNILESRDINYQNNIQKTNLLNLMWSFKNDNRGTYNYKDKWEIIDQMMLSSSLLKELSSKNVGYSMSIIQHDWMMQKGKYAGHPLRNFGGNNWLNGYSDHLPIKLKLYTKNE
jgi:predicted extracellular nuclease